MPTGVASQYLLFWVKRQDHVWVFFHRAAVFLSVVFLNSSTVRYEISTAYRDSLDVEQRFPELVSHGPVHPVGFTQRPHVTPHGGLAALDRCKSRYAGNFHFEYCCTIPKSAFSGWQVRLVGCALDVEQ